VILDTNALSALLAGDAALGKVLAGTERHHLPVIVLGEYRYGMLGSRFREHLQSLLEILIRDPLCWWSTRRRPGRIPRCDTSSAKRAGRFRKTTSGSLLWLDSITSPSSAVMATSTTCRGFAE